MASKRMTGEWRVDRAAYADGAAFVEGTFVPVAEARVPILDWGFLRSDATYDVAHVWRGAFFRLEDHLDRFERSMDRLPRHRDVALHRGERDPEGAGGLALCHASPGYRFDDLLPEVPRVCVHPSMMPDGSATLRPAVGRTHRRPAKPFRKDKWSNG